MLHIGCHLSSSKGFAAMGRFPACQGTSWILERGGPPFREGVYYLYLISLQILLRG